MTRGKSDTMFSVSFEYLLYDWFEDMVFISSSWRSSPCVEASFGVDSFVVQ